MPVHQVRAQFFGDPGTVEFDNGPVHYRLWAHIEWKPEVPT